MKTLIPCVAVVQSFPFFSVATVILKLVSLLPVPVHVYMNIFYCYPCPACEMCTYYEELFLNVLLVIRHAYTRQYYFNVSNEHRGHLIPFFFIIIIMFLRLSVLMPVRVELSGEITYFNCYVAFLYEMLLCLFVYYFGEKSYKHINSPFNFEKQCHSHTIYW